VASQRPGNLSLRILWILSVGRLLGIHLLIQASYASRVLVEIHVLVSSGALKPATDFPEATGRVELHIFSRLSRSDPSSPVSHRASKVQLKAP